MSASLRPHRGGTLPRFTVRGLLVGALLGLVWYGLLLLPRFSRNELIESTDRSPWRMLVLMVLASALLTAVFPLDLVRSRLRTRLVVGLLLPIVGALLYSGLVLATDYLIIVPDVISDHSENPAGPISGLLGLVSGMGLMAIVGVPVITVAVLTQVYFVAFPMGLLHAELARRVSASTTPAVPE